MTDTVTPRTCGRCGGTKYYDGKQWRCRPCLTRVQAARRNRLPPDQVAAETLRANGLRNARRLMWSPEKRAAVNAEVTAWREANRERHREMSRDWYWRNVERARAAKVAEYERNPMAFLARNLVRKARQRDQVCDHGAACVSSEFLCWLYEQSCMYCGAPAEHADHFVPLARGGLHCRENLVPACQPCNASKKARDPVEWLGSRM